MGVEFVNHEHDHRQNWTTRSPVTINHNRYNFRTLQIHLGQISLVETMSKL